MARLFCHSCDSDCGTTLSGVQPRHHGPDAPLARPRHALLRPDLPFRHQPGIVRHIGRAAAHRLGPVVMAVVLREPMERCAQGFGQRDSDTVYPGSS